MILDRLLGRFWDEDCITNASGPCLKSIQKQQADTKKTHKMVGRTQQASERSERSERSVEKILRCTSGPNELDPYVFEGLGYSPEDVAKRFKRSVF